MSAGKSWDVEATLQWLLDEGRLLPTIEEVTRQLGQHLFNAGAPLCRFRLSMRTLHPLLAASTSVWERDDDLVAPIETPHGIEQRAEFIGSPFQIIINTRNTFRRRLDTPLSEQDHTALHELKAAGLTDYFGLPLAFTEESMAIVVFSSDQTGGFSDRDIENFTQLSSVLAPIAEVFSVKRMSTAISEAYLGKRTGQRVLDGQIVRGDIEKMTAAILMSDIRDWTGLNNRLSPDAALSMANRYFDVIAESIESNGGEILKFIGDSVLAVFPLDSNSNSTTVCTRALDAAQQALLKAQQAAPALNLEFGIGLHIGEVLYGNIGSTTRLDFTVMGQAVNTTARIESLCSKFNTPLLFSADFAEQLPHPTRLIAEEVLKGHDTTVKVMSV